MITYTFYAPGIFISVLISVICWIFFSRLRRPDNGSTDRFEAFIDAIIAIVITIIVLEIPMAANGSWDALFSIKLEALFFLSLIPYLTTFVAENADSFFPCFLYGLDFIIVAILSIVTANALKNSDKANIALQIALSDNKPYLSTIILVLIGMVIGYFVYPLAIVIACLVSIITLWLISYYSKKH